MLQAEEDRDQVRRYWADQAREKELLGDNLKVYHTDRYAIFLPPGRPIGLTHDQIRETNVCSCSIQANKMICLLHMKGS